MAVLSASVVNWLSANENPSLAAGVFCEGPVLEGELVHLGRSRDFLGNIDSGVMLLLHHVHAAIGFGEQLLRITSIFGIEGCADAQRDDLFASDAHLGETKVEFSAREKPAFEDDLRDIDTGVIHILDEEAVQEVRGVFVDCDADTVLLKVRQVGGAACHEGYKSCFFRELAGGELRVVGDRVFDPKAVYKK